MLAPTQRERVNKKPLLDNQSTINRCHDDTFRNLRAIHNSLIESLYKERKSIQFVLKYKI